MTMSKAEQAADKLALHLVELGFLKFILPGKFRPIAAKKCGTCAFFEFNPDGNGIGMCIPKSHQYGMADTACTDHQWSGIIMQLLEAGLPL